MHCSCCDKRPTRMAPAKSSSGRSRACPSANVRCRTPVPSIVRPYGKLTFGWHRDSCAWARVTDIKAISKFAQMEFKFGEVERGRTIFEGIMSNYPKRADLWNIYCDMEERVGELPVIR